MKYFLIVLISVVLCAFTNHQTKSSYAQVNRVSGMYIFVDSKPVSEYEYLGSSKLTVTWALSAQYQTVRDKLIKRVQKEYPKANGIIFHFHDLGSDIADAIIVK